jgi:hypothetical protein
VYDGQDRLTSIQLVTYPDSASANADTGALSTITITSTYDVDGNLTTLLAKE